MQILKDSGTGRTTRMIEHMPEDGCAVVVTTQSMREHIETMICKIRGAAYLKKVRFVTAYSGCVDQLRGTEKPVYMDHFVSESAAINPETLKRLLEFMSVHNAKRIGKENRITRGEVGEETENQGKDKT